MSECSCQLLPIRELEAEIGRPLSGWNPEILVEDDLGRVSVTRETARHLIEERRAAEQNRLAEDRARRAAAPPRPAPVGVRAPVGINASALELMMGYDPE